MRRGRESPVAWNGSPVTSSAAVAGGAFPLVAPSGFAFLAGGGIMDGMERVAGHSGRVYHWRRGRLRPLDDCILRAGEGP